MKEATTQKGTQMKKYRVVREGSGEVTKPLSLERAEKLAARFAAKSPHLTFTVVQSG